ncbi:MAG TPA: gamma-glutamylcyclotransferase [Phnomibacter sp.]|nr:gamma-glutamylcyclotransferase [Phnomibacter sp.]
MVYNVFVYGSLRQGFGSEAYQYISHYFNLVSMASIEGALYDLGPYPAAKPTAEGHRIIGELYTIKDPDEWNWAIGQLDDYEGVNPSYDEPALYERQLTTVTLADGSRQQAWVYWYTRPVEGYPIVASGDVLEYMRERMG